MPQTTVSIIFKIIFNLFAISYPSFNPISNPVCIDEDRPEAFTYTLVSPNFYSLYSLEDCIGFIKNVLLCSRFKTQHKCVKMSKNTNVDDKLSSLIIHLQSKRTLPFLQSNFKKCRTNKSPYLTKVRLCFRITHRRTYYFVETLLELSTQMHSKSKEISPIMRRGNIRQKKEIR